tara:strand:- start:111287 stop:111829 length:543 start_codon:yes stop_codon:yes gene_type:complete
VKQIFLALVAVAMLGITTSAHANTFGVKFNPITILIGYVDVDIDIAITNNIVITPSFQSWNFEFGDFDYEIQGVGGSISYHFSGALQDSFYLGGSFRSLSLTLDDEFTGETAEADVTASGVILGYQWVWDSFYMNLGAFAGSASESEIDVEDSSGNLTGETEDVPATLGVGLDFKLGWSF